MSRAKRMHRGAVGGRGRAWPTAPLPHALPAQGLEAGGKPVIVTGDLNCAHREIDIHSPKTNLRSAVMTCMPLPPPPSYHMSAVMALVLLRPSSVTTPTPLTPQTAHPLCNACVLLVCCLCTACVLPMYCLCAACAFPALIPLSPPTSGPPASPLRSATASRHALSTAALQVKACLGSPLWPLALAPLRQLVPSSAVGTAFACTCPPPPSRGQCLILCPLQTRSAVSPPMPWATPTTALAPRRARPGRGRWHACALHAFSPRLPAACVIVSSRIGP